ncbi:glycerophosphodiester phosphodiesterase family protein [Microbacterium sp. W1N]|uniref:glycerophosphodiester phosphodiesterase family protein n=1 Tax=Microbacterium festucae TaxID=2977531 RepID=UPI0021C1A871|nr:glycerophosphodiester phosphodiesterase family protein [Microbacterium festucae]MCT9820182.1 glycerophosphodiester phosphodiesterase family protein [Microbacterium festucae]
MTHPWFRGRAPRILAHRGLVPADAEGIAENTAAAFAAAHAAGAQYVESDCHTTADGVVVLFHDDDLSRVTGDPRKVAEVTAAELTEIMSTRGGLLTLAQALDAFPTLRFNLDVKVASAAQQLGRAIARHADRVLVASFSDARRREAVAAAVAAGGTPAASAGTGTIARLLLAHTLRSRALARRALRGVDAVQVPERYGILRVVTRRFVATAHAAGVEVHVWTVNDADAMRRLLAMGVDGLVTDRADLALAVVAGRA